MRTKKAIKVGDDQVELIIADITDKIKKGELQNGAKLDSEGNLVQTYRTNVYCVRKAIRKLKQSGLVYSVPKFGVFIGNEKKLNKEDPGQPVVFNTNIMDPTTINIKSDTLPQYSIWENIRSEIQKEYQDSNIILAADVQEYDISELWTGQNKQKENLSDYINLKKYFPDYFPYPPHEKYPFEMPFYDTSGILIFNQDLLEKHGIPLPSYQNFEEQNAYLKKTLNHIRELGLQSPGTSQDFALIIGMEQQHEIFNDLAFNDISEKEFLQKYTPLFEQAMEVYKSYHSDFPHNPTQAKVDFALGGTPFFFGLTSDYLELKTNIKKFRVNGAMVYSTDNTVKKFQVSLGLHEKVARIASKVKILKEFQMPHVQTLIARAGMLPLDPALYSELPYHLIIPQSGERSCYLSAEEFYVMCDIVSSELWRIILMNDDQTEILKDIYFFSKAYLSIHKDKCSGEEWELWKNRHLT